MSEATEKLRAMLDERGVEYGTRGGMAISTTYWRDGRGFLWSYLDDGETSPMLLLASGPVTLTPEQAIAATLGSEPVVRCRDCSYAGNLEPPMLNCRGPLVELWDYENDEPKVNPVEPGGFCAWGVRR